jgi:hypothetical protein
MSKTKPQRINARQVKQFLAGAQKRAAAGSPRDGLGRSDVVARIPVVIPRGAAKVFLNDLLPPRESVAAANWEIMAAWLKMSQSDKNLPCICEYFLGHENCDFWVGNCWHPEVTLLELRTGADTSSRHAHGSSWSLAPASSRYASEAARPPGAASWLSLPITLWA